MPPKLRQLVKQRRHEARAHHKATRRICEREGAPQNRLQLRPGARTSKRPSAATKERAEPRAQHDQRQAEASQREKLYNLNQNAAHDQGSEKNLQAGKRAAKQTPAQPRSVPKGPLESDKRHESQKPRPTRARKGIRTRNGRRDARRTTESSETEPYAPKTSDREREAHFRNAVKAKLACKPRDNANRQARSEPAQKCTTRQAGARINRGSERESTSGKARRM